VGVAGLDGATGSVAAATTIHVTAGGGDPIHVALVEADGRRVFAKLDAAQAAPEAEPVEAGQRVQLRLDAGGDLVFRPGEGRGSALGRFVGSLRRRVGGGS
jgi:hypothetical protein